ncbi:unnamed protein product [Pseudo-nitzschia multistriata]|uniref:Cathepsin propeptide inhibitor domain-containing protein n=1 Tax=Pseudo-nitzschia multistriata TaxID=183589 RepID=A0A448Z0N6_9STRA|nr:unnamed protein product [Pseudo-nitzschia multistriata]
MIQTSSRFLGRLLGFTSLLILLESSGAFQPRKQNQASTPSKSSSDEKKTVMSDEMNILFERHDRVANDLIDKAQEFASHFGKYSYGEVENMRDNLHKHRVQNMAIGNDEYSSDMLFLERVLEDDLNFQLAALEADMPEPYLFRYPDKDPVATASVEAVADPIIFHESLEEDKVANYEKSNLYGELVQEGVIESIAICAILGFLMVTPAHVW